MAILKKERVPCCGIEDKYIDALLKKDSPSLSLDLSLLVIITRFEIIPPVSDLAVMFFKHESEIEYSLNHLTEIGFLSLT
jgi:hypothetical protein